jgi:cholesterol transport system auxiliary component
MMTIARLTTRRGAERKRGASARRAAAAAALSLLLASCAGAPVLDSFDLAPARPAPARALRGQLRVVEPIAAVNLDSDRILVRSGPERIAALAGARWAAPLPALIQTRLTQTLENAGLLGEVSRRTSARADYELEVDIRKFELNAASSQAEVDLAVTIVSASDGRTVAAQAFAASAPVAAASGPEVSTALDGALSTVMTRIVAFVAARI